MYACKFYAIVYYILVPQCTKAVSVVWAGEQRDSHLPARIVIPTDGYRNILDVSLYQLMGTGTRNHKKQSNEPECLVDIDPVIELGNMERERERGGDLLLLR